MQDGRAGSFLWKKVAAGIVIVVLTFMMFYRFSAHGTTSGTANESEGKITVDDQGSTVTISNSIVSASIDKASAVLSSLTYNGGPNLLANGGGGYYILNYSVSDKHLTFAPKNDLSYHLTAVDSQHADVALSIKDPKKLPFEYEMHFVVVKNEPGIYFYEILRYPEDVPGGAAIEQGRYAFRVDPKLFKSYAVDDTRKGLLPTPTELKNGVDVMDATKMLANGQAYTKYNHLVYVGDFKLTGLYGDRIGITQIHASNEFVGGGPMQQRNTLHQTDTTPILLWQDHESHMGRDDLKPAKGWEKIYGPSMLYIHEGNGLDDLWQDAKRKAEEETKKWPYQWLDSPLYLANQRGTVSGQVTVADGTSPKDAWILLTVPTSDWQNQTLDYNYYTKADSEGKFKIPSVRPGSYTLYAVVKGEFGEFRHDGVSVKAAENVKLPPFVWSPESNGKTLWQIGVPDRTAGEYKHGDDYHQWGLWLQYPLDFPHGVDFYVGHSKESSDWNYVQPVNATPGEPNQVKVPYDKSLTPWKIRFDLDKPMTGKGTLTFGIAGSRNGTLHVELNGKQIADITSLPGPKSDSAMPRSAIHGFYREVKVPFDASLLHQGQNVIVLQHAKNIFDSQGNRTKDLYTSLMYDAIRMEVQ